MDIKEYQEKSKRTLPTNFTDEELIKNMCLGLGGEIGEVLDIFKKYFYQGHSLDIKNVIDEMGDIMFYMANLCNILEIDLEIILDYNYNKLLNRYPNGFDVERSVNRG